MIELIFNELSIDSTISNHLAKGVLDNFIDTFIESSNLFSTKIQLRTLKNLMYTPIGENFTFFDYINDNEIDQERRTHLLTLIAQNPFIEKEFFADYDIKCYEKYSASILYAFLSNSVVTSFSNNEKWQVDNIPATLFYVKDTEVYEDEVSIKNIYSISSAKIHTNFLKLNFLKEIKNGAYIADNHKSLFPNLEMHKNVIDILRTISSNNPKFIQIVNSFLILNDFCENKKSAKNYKDLAGLGLYVRPDSKPTLEKYATCREITYKKEKIKFSLHFSINPGSWRCYIIPLGDFSEILISYLGKHLPTVSFK